MADNFVPQTVFCRACGTFDKFFSESKIIGVLPGREELRIDWCNYMEVKLNKQIYKCINEIKMVRWNMDEQKINKQRHEGVQN